MNALEQEAQTLVTDLMLDISLMVQANPSDCLTFLVAEGRTGALFGRMNNDHLEKFQAELAAFHHEAGCNLEIEHHTLVEVLSIHTNIAVA